MKSISVWGIISDEANQCMGIISDEVNRCMGIISDEGQSVYGDY